MTNELQNSTSEQELNLLEVIKTSENLAHTLYFCTPVYNRCKQLAKIMADSAGITPKHLVGKQEACFSVVTRSMLWKLDPFSVANATFDVKGNIGYKGSLCRAILEKSNQFERKLRYEKIPDAKAWERVQGKFQMLDSKKQADANGESGKYAKATYTEKDEEGLGVRIYYKLHGQEETFYDFYLKQANPRFSTLWATDPWTQLCYLATRRFGNVEVPEIFMGVPFDKEDLAEQDSIIDVTPKKERSEAHDFNQTLREKKQAKENVSVVEIPKEDAKPDAGTPANQDVSEPEISAIDAKAQQIIDLIETSRNPQQAYDDNHHHVLCMPESLQTKISDALRGAL